MSRFTHIRQVGKSPISLVVVIAAVAVIALKPLALVNNANLRWLHGDTHGARNSFAQALILRPDDARLRLQQARFLGFIGDWNGAFNALSQLPNSLLNSPEHARRYVTAAIFTRHPSVAMNAYASAEPRLEVPRNLAIALIGAAHQSSDLDLDVVRALFARGFDLDPASQMASRLSRDFASGGTSDGKVAAIHEAITWLSRPLPTAVSDYSAQGVSQIAELLGVPVSTVTLGSEFLGNGGFEDVNPIDRLPNGWEPHWWVRQPNYNSALFVVGVDCARKPCSGRALRVDGLQEASNGGRERARAGLWHPALFLEPGAPYVASFEYRTPDGVVDARPSAFFSTDPMAFVSEVVLPATNGKWKTVTIIGWNRTGAPAPIAPLFRLWGEGTAWFDNASVRQVNIGLMVAPRDSIIEIRD